MLPPDEPTPDMRYLPFYRLGGDFPDAAYLIALIQRRIKTTKAEVNGVAISSSHAQVTIDDVLHHPSLVGFARVLNQEQLQLIQCAFFCYKTRFLRHLLVRGVMIGWL
jgi:hypothetical protein